MYNNGWAPFFNAFYFNCTRKIKLNVYIRSLLLLNVWRNLCVFVLKQRMSILTQVKSCIHTMKLYSRCHTCERTDGLSIPIQFQSNCVCIVRRWKAQPSNISCVYCTKIPVALIEVIVKVDLKSNFCIGKQF